MFLVEEFLAKFLRHKVPFFIDAQSDFLGNFFFLSDLIFCEAYGYNSYMAYSFTCLNHSKIK